MNCRIIITFAMVILTAAHSAFSAKMAQKNAAPPKADRAAEERTSSVNVLSIIPAQGEPGITVTLYGTGFTDKTVAFLGNQEVPTKVLGAKQLSFEIPKLASGLYALFLKREDGTTSKIYNFTLLPQKPVATSLSPDRIDACASGKEREVTISGHNFQEKSQVLFNGAAIRSRFISENSLAFTVPQIAAGLHQVQVKNAEDTTSGALGLFINAKPEVESVTQGEDYVTYYNLIISGRNFQQGSALVITEEKNLEQTADRYAVNTRRIFSGATNTIEREKLIYVNCNRIIYQRFPYSTALKNFSIQVINPNGEESSPTSVSAP